MDHRKRTRRLRPLLLLSIVLGGACGDSGGPRPNGVRGAVVSPNGNEGAAVLEFAGVVDSVTVVGGVAYLRSAGGVTRAALILDQPGTIRFSLPGIAVGSAPAAVLVEVADGSNALRATVAGYRVEYDR
jgi:hypothetical protein